MKTPPFSPSAPEAERAPPPTAPAVPRQWVRFSAEQHFGIDRNGQRDEVRATLDAFVALLQGIRYDSIQVEGHTNRLGTQTYNQTLSQQRADAAKGYLLTAGGVQGDKISATGRVESMPVTKPNDCQAKRQSKALIAGLAPVRRVDVGVEVVGTR